MLVFVGDPEDPNLRVADEFDVIVGALREVPGRWDVELLTKPSSKSLREVLEDFRPHVLHMITHGAVEEASGSVVLVMPLEGGVLGADHLRHRRPAEPAAAPGGAQRLPVRLAGDRPGGALDLYRRVPAARVRCGGDHAGQHPLRGGHPVLAAFYREVALGSGVDVAAARGRQAAYDELKEDRGDQRSWALPSLYLATPPSGCCRCAWR
jgi:hypothetical protein